MKTYTMTVAGVTRELPICQLNENLSIAGFVVFGDVELTVACAGELLKKAPAFDYMLAPEAKAIPVIHEMARQAGINEYIIVRKKKKAYMQNILEANDKSITTFDNQKLFMDGKDAEKIRGKRVLIIDDVVSTGGSLLAVESLVKQAGGLIAGKMAVLAEGKAAERNDIIYLEPLPLFDGEGNQL